MKKILLTAILLIGTLTVFAQSNRVHDYNPTTRGKFNVLDYGADRTGATESTTALQAALNACDSGTVYIPEGYYLTGTLVVPNDNITIKGDGKYLSTLKLKNEADAGDARGDLIYLAGADNVTIRDIGLDGNMSNQTAIDSPGTVTANSVGVYARDSVTNTATNNLLIQDCYIHHFAQSGVIWYVGDGCTVEDCVVTYNGWGDIEFYGTLPGTEQITKNGFILNNTTGHTGNISIDVYGSSMTVQGNIILPMDGAYGTTDYPRGIQIEGATSWITPTNILIKDNIINGGGYTLMGIVGGPRLKSCSIQGNIISDLDYQSLTGDDSYGIWLKGDTASIISDNHIIRYAEDQDLYHGIMLEDCMNTMVSSNIIKDATNRGIYLDNSDSCKVNNNIVECHATYYGPIRLLADCANNVIKDNILITHSPYVVDIVTDAGTDNAIIGNYSTYLTSQLPSNVVTKMTRTASADGTGAGIIKPGSQFVTVTSANADYICCLPSASALTVGTVIKGIVGANGFELRVAAAQAATVYLNGVTTNVEAAIPANTSFEVTQVDATHWILKAWTALGAEITAIVPDAI